MTFAKKMNELIDIRINTLHSVEQYLDGTSQQFYNKIRSSYPIAPSSFYFEDPNFRYFICCNLKIAVTPSCILTIAGHILL